MNTLKLLPVLASCLLLTSCGEKGDESPAQESSSKIDVVAQREENIKAAIREQVSSITSDLMLKVPQYIDVPSPEYIIPEVHVGREIVKVSVKWPLVAKEDLYIAFDELHGFDNEVPLVVDLTHKKSEQVDYVACDYVLHLSEEEYQLNRSKVTKQNFSVRDSAPLSDFSYVKTFVKGTEEYHEAKRVSDNNIKEKEEKQRLEKMEQERLAKEKRSKNIVKFKNTLKKGDVFTGMFIRTRSTKDFVLTLEEVSVKGGDENYKFSVVQAPEITDNFKYPAIYSGTYSDDGSELVLFCDTTGKAVYKNNETHSYETWLFMKRKNYNIRIEMTDHHDKIKVKADHVDPNDDYFYENDFIRKK